MKHPHSLQFGWPLLVGLPRLVMKLRVGPQVQKLGQELPADAILYGIFGLRVFPRPGWDVLLSLVRGLDFWWKKSGGKMVDVTETSHMISTDKVIEDKWKRKQKL